MQKIHRLGERGDGSPRRDSGTRRFPGGSVRYSNTAAHAREALTRLGQSTLGPHEYLREVSLLVGRVVPHLGSCWATLDPDTNLPSGPLQTDMSPELVRALCRNAILDDDLNSVATLARRRIPIGTLSELPPAALARSHRVQIIHRSAGIGDELRLLLRADGAIWARGALHRPAGEAPFTAQDRFFLAAVLDEITAGLRARLSQRPPPAEGYLAPGVATFDAQYRLIGITHEAAAIMALMPGDACITLEGIALAAARHGDASARVRLTDGRWWLLQGSRVQRQARPRPTAVPAPAVTTEVAVSLTAAPRATIAPILLKLHALSAREREVARLLLRGMRTDEIAAALHISPHTVGDHVKAIFTKLGVRHRAELMALDVAYVAPY
jgi:DNA-binding CsgD family transcriptional regulator